MKAGRVLGVERVRCGSRLRAAFAVVCDVPSIAVSLRRFRTVLW